MQLTRLRMRADSFGRATVVDDGLELSANATTDWFFSPADQPRRANVPTASLEVSDRIFSISARVSVGFAATYDAGFLYVKASDDNWAKLAYEYSAGSQPTVVSVVTRTTSDDCDGPVHAADAVWLRIYGNGDTLAFHYSEDGRFWRFVRFFTIPGISGRPLEIGFGAQSPKGDGATARFSDIALESRLIDNLRNGD